MTDPALNSSQAAPVEPHDEKELRKLKNPFFWFVALSFFTAFLIPSEPLTLLGVPEWKVVLQDWTPMLLWGGANLAFDPELVTVHTFLISWASLAVAMYILIKPIRLVEPFRLKANPKMHGFLIFITIALLFYVVIETGPDIRFSGMQGSAHLKSRTGLAFVHSLYFVHVAFFIAALQYLRAIVAEGAKKLWGIG